MKDRFPTRLVAILAVAAIVVGVVGGVLLVRRDSGTPSTPLLLGELEAAIEEGRVSEVTIGDRTNTVTGTLEDGTRFEVSYPAEYSSEVTRQLLDAGVPTETDPQPQAIWPTVLLQMAPMLIIVLALGGLFLVMQRGGGMFGGGKPKARQFGKGEPPVTFSDVAGCDEAVEDLKEIRDFLRDPDRFHALGASIPRGVLLYGPPGTGKTLLARAVAGEAQVPFFSLSGSDFVEVFGGLGASRVRALFQQARQAAPAIVFVDEIDAVGRQRGANVGGGNEEGDQTLNQLLVEMDGFEDDGGVLVVAATNRPDILDPALLRPGRFDRQIMVDRPDRTGRRVILEVHARGKPLAPDVDLDVVARRTPGFTGADLQNTLNEAAILAARRSHLQVTQDDVASAIDRVVAGPERSSRVMSERERSIVAYHEAGHALVGHVLPNTDPVHKISIVARGRSLGWTLSLPTEDRTIRSRAELRDQMAMLMGGRTAEEITFGDPTTGAMDDLERATGLARSMVLELGMSDPLGPRHFGTRTAGLTPDREPPPELAPSDELAALIDSEVRRFLDEAHTEAREILTLHRATLDRLAAALIDRETLDEAELEDLFGRMTTAHG